jgi:hypothetical protein
MLTPREKRNLWASADRHLPSPEIHTGETPPELSYTAPPVLGQKRSFEQSDPPIVHKIALDRGHIGSGTELVKPAVRRKESHDSVPPSAPVLASSMSLPDPVFKGCRILLLANRIGRIQLNVMRTRIVEMGGIMVDSVSDHPTHVVTALDSPGVILVALGVATLPDTASVVNFNWISDSLDRSFRLPVDSYLLRTAPAAAVSPAVVEPVGDPGHVSVSAASFAGGIERAPSHGRLVPPRLDEPLAAAPTKDDEEGNDLERMLSTEDRQQRRLPAATVRWLRSNPFLELKGGGNALADIEDDDGELTEPCSDGNPDTLPPPPPPLSAPPPSRAVPAFSWATAAGGAGLTLGAAAAAAAATAATTMPPDNESPLIGGSSPTRNRSRIQSGASSRAHSVGSSPLSGAVPLPAAPPGVPSPSPGSDAAARAFGLARSMRAAERTPPIPGSLADGVPTPSPGATPPPYGLDLTPSERLQRMPVVEN